MLKIFISVIFVFAAVVATSAQSAEKLVVTEGSQKTSVAGRLTIRFVEVIEDSRCPEGAACIWAGTARIRITVAKGRMAPATYELATEEAARSIKVDGFEITLVDMTSRPSPDLERPDKPIAATFKITKM